MVRFIIFKMNLVIFQSLPGFEGQVAWHNVAQLTLLLRTSSRVNARILEKFHKFDLYKFFVLLYRNNDDYLSFNQFFNFIAQCPELCDSLYHFRQLVVDAFFPEDYGLIILNRRLHINMIKDYQIIHNGKLPPAVAPSSLRNLQIGEINEQHVYNCFENFVRFLKNQPHPYQFDYSPIFTFHSSYIELCTIIIKKYNPEYIHIKELFHMKHLTNMSPYPYQNEVDAYYIQFHKMLPRSRVKSDDTICSGNFVATSSTSIHLSRKSSLQPKQYNMKKNVKSILRKSTNSFSKSRKTSVGIAPYPKRTCSLSLRNGNIVHMNSVLSATQLPNSVVLSTNTENYKISCNTRKPSKSGLVMFDGKLCEFSSTSFAAIPEIVN